MTLTLRQSTTAVAVNLTASFLASGGVDAPVYAVLPGGAGGTISSSTGVYTAPAAVSEVPAALYDTIRATDGVTSVTAQILVGTPLLLFCEILQKEMGLASERVYLWDQKIMQPKDNGLYIAVSVLRCKPFSNINRPVSSGSGMTAQQTVNMHAILDLNIISRGPAARDRKEEVILAFNSDYAQRQQEGNSFYIGKLPPNAGFLNLSDVDGAAIPYRYQISVALQYAFTKTKAIQSYNDFADPTQFTD